MAIGVSFSLSFPDDHVPLERRGRKRVGNRKGDWILHKCDNEVAKGKQEIGRG